MFWAAPLFLKLLSQQCDCLHVTDLLSHLSDFKTCSLPALEFSFEISVVKLLFELLFFFPQASIFVCLSILLLMKPRTLRSYPGFPNIIWQLPRLATISSVGSRRFWPTITMRYLKFISRRWAGGIRFLYLSWLVTGDYFSQNFESCTVTGNLLCGCGTLNVIASMSS